MREQAGSIEEIQQALKSGNRWLACGGGSKPRLSGALHDAAILDMRQIKGIIEYDPGEYTFTAYAGTPIKDIQIALAENGQYLPFDPLLVEQGATLGGTVAANTSGSGRWRYGGIRDFILGIRFVDGQGQLVRSGGKVVKNAAGFDLSKFFVGSLGQYGILTELSFKVFPRPPAYRTLEVTFASLPEALATVFKLTASPLEADAIDIVPQSDAAGLIIRISGLETSLPARLDRWQNTLSSDKGAQAIGIIHEDKDLWREMTELAWCPAEANIIKVPVASKQVVQLDERLREFKVRRRYIAAGNIAWISADAAVPLASILTELQLSGLVLRGKSDHAVIGHRPGLAFAQRIKQVLDPNDIFGEV
jgi:glycolate oxidase FAD binding subunit